MELKLNDPLTYKIKIPTDEELETYVNGEWNRVEYDNLRPKSINYLLRNYIAYDPASSWLSGYFNLVPFQNVYINSPQLSDYKYSAPNNFSSSVIKKVQINQQLGGVISDYTSPTYADFIDVGGKNIKRLHFKITTSRNEVIDFHGVPIQFSLLFQLDN